VSRPEPNTRERRLFRAAVAAVAVHAATDALFAPEPATHWSDHVSRGAVTLALLGAAAAAYSRMRPGGRAAVAGALGVLALEGSMLAFADARAGGVRGEDWTGFLLAPAGVALCLLASALLWRSRRGGRLRHLRRAVRVAGAGVAAFVLLVPIAVAIVATHRPRQTVHAVDLGRPASAVTITTRDGLNLAAWYVPSRNGAAVISFPTRIGKVPEARMLARHGYGVLLLDARGYDGSEGDSNLFGWGEASDIDAAVAWLQKRPGVRDDAVGGIGFSVGGEVMLEAAASNPSLRAVVSEGAGARSVREELIRGPRGWVMVPELAVQTAAVAVLSGTVPPPSLDAFVARIAPRPVFLIYAGRSNAGEDLNVEYFRAARPPKILWRIPEARHVGGFDARPREYERRVTEFFDGALLR